MHHGTNGGVGLLPLPGQYKTRVRSVCLASAVTRVAPPWGRLRRRFYAASGPDVDALVQVHLGLPLQYYSWGRHVLGSSTYTCNGFLDIMDPFSHTSLNVAL